MKRIILYAAFMALIVFALKVMEYQYWVKRLPREFYIGLIAVIFTTVGAWLGFRFTSQRRIVVMLPAVPFFVNESNLIKSGITKREHDVLALMAKGLTNQQIADRLSLSLNTVKTHISSVFVKLDVRRRTQAIQKAKTWGLVE